MATLEYDDASFQHYLHACDEVALKAEAGAYQHIKYARLGKVGYSVGSIPFTLGTSTIVAAPYAVWAGTEA